MNLKREKRMTQIEIWLKQMKYPHLPQNNTSIYINAMITGTESRITVLEFMLLKFCQTLFALNCGDNDYTNMEKRIDCVKILILQSGLWGQSKFGRNVDLNKLIEGLCSFEMSLNFLYKITKKVFLTLNSKQIYNQIHTSQDMRHLQMEQYNLFLECLKSPHQMINPNVNPFPISFPQDDDHEIIESQEILEQEVIQDNNFLKSQHDRLSIKLATITDIDLKYLDQNILEAKDIQDFVLQINQLNLAIAHLKRQEGVLKILNTKNDSIEKNKNIVKFPDDYLENFDKFNDIRKKLNQ